MSGLYAFSVCISLIAIGHFDDSKIGPSDSTADKLAIDELKKLGATVGLAKTPNDGMDGEQFRYVVIKKDWKGGDDGLIYVEQLTNVRALYLVGSVKISAERLQKLTKKNPQITVQRRTDAFLGIMSNVGGDHEGVRVTNVVQDSPAAKAGILRGDLITQFDDKAVKGWDEFVEMFTAKNAEDEIKLTINRNGKSVEVKATLLRRIGNSP